jgi:phosphotriesterase-related protein
MTVLGPVDRSELGRILVHEHVQVNLPGSELDPGFDHDRPGVVATATERLIELRELGVRTFVDPCPIELGRDVELLAEVSRASGVNIVCATGFYFEQDGIGIPHYWRLRWPEEIAELFIREITDGVGDTGIRPGVIKIATGDPVGRHELKVLTAAGIASEQTGTPIISHTVNSRFGDIQQDVLESAGADLSRAVIGHLDQASADEIDLIANRGSFIGIDRVGFSSLATDESRVELIGELIKLGHGGQICLAQDRACVDRAGRPNFWIPKNQTPRREKIMQQIARETHGSTHAQLFTHFWPKLLESGVSTQQAEDMVTSNPARWLLGQYQQN